MERDKERGGGERGSARWERGRKREQYNSGGGNRNEDGNGDGDEDGIREGGEEAKKRKKPHKTCVGNGGDLGAMRNKRKKERV